MKRAYILILLFFVVSLRTTAQKTLSEWQEKLRTAKHDTTKLRCYGGILELSGHPDSMMKYLKKIDVLSKKYPNHLANIGIFVSHAFLFQYKNIIDSANYYYKKAHTLALKLHHDKYMKHIEYYQIYNVKTPSEQIKALYQLLKKHQYHHSNLSDKSLQYNIYNDLANIYLSFGNIDKAKNLINTAMPYRVNTADSSMYFTVITRLIALDAERTLSSDKPQPKVAFSDIYKPLYAELSFFSEKNKLPDLRIEPLLNYGHILFCEKKYNEALNKAQELLNHAQKYKNLRAMNLSYLLFGETYSELGQYQKTLEFALKNNTKSGVLYYRKLKGMSKAYKALGNHEKAYQYLLETTKEEERLKGVNEQLYAAEIEKQLELAEKQKEIDFSELENKFKEERLKTEQQQRIALKLISELELSNKEKEISIQKNEIYTQKSKSIIKDELIKIEQKQKTMFIGLLALSLGLLFWALWNYHKQKQLSILLAEQSNVLTEANQTKDKIFAVLGHDLRSPINELKTILMLFHSRDITPLKMKELIHSLSIKIEVVQEMMNNLLQWSLLELKHQGNAPQMVFANKIIEKVIHQLKASADKKQLHIETSLPAVQILAQEEDLDIIIRNLLSNAIKFTPKGGNIWIDNMEGNETVSIKIRDTGVGLPVEIIEKSTLYPASHIGTIGETGTGIGLKISRELVEKNGGVFTFENNSPNGTVISLVFKKFRHRRD